MTSNEAVAKAKSIMGDDWPKMKPVPEEAIITVCEALWAQGIRPNIHTFASVLPWRVDPRLRAWNHRMANPARIPTKGKISRNRANRRLGATHRTGNSECAIHL